MQHPCVNVHHSWLLSLVLRRLFIDAFWMGLSQQLSPLLFVCFSFPCAILSFALLFTLLCAQRRAALENHSVCILPLIHLASCNIACSILSKCIAVCVCITDRLERSGYYYFTLWTYSWGAGAHFHTVFCYHGTHKLQAVPHLLLDHHTEKKTLSKIYCHTGNIVFLVYV